jgi:hypothetical protein
MAMDLLLKDVFLKPVDRPIDGVIKADDEASLRIELEEYVVTGEIAQKFEHFLDAYNNYSNANGVWISGFFGSGKSHLLKMLAYILENREVEGTAAYDIFRGKCAENPMLAGALRKAVSIPSKSILFNIDQKADVISKSEVDALLSVFQKVFDEMCGYFGKQPHIAQFERDMDERGDLSAFKEAYHAASGRSWEYGREQALLEKSNIAKAYASVRNSAESDVADILGQYRADHRVSIDDFAGAVKTWLDKQDPHFRLNFFVDEVGQYIAENTKLMTNLQTIAESLNTRCKGQAWLIVTAQQDMVSVIGDMTTKQENDFSKIQARFANRLPLNSADVAEVIQRRLLAKNETGTAILQNLYSREENNLKTLFDFSDGSIRLKNFEGRTNFVDSYPFPPYQYTLFQSAITGLSQHNAFEGKHSSVGERSMLGVFQEVAKNLADHPIEGLATFDLMFEGIRPALKSSVQRSIILAQKNLGDEFAIRVLKSLFLVKYIREFKPTIRNISILLLSDFKTNQTEQKRKIEDALNLLERETYIQRNGEFYEFLTNEEKDIESEIKAMDVDPSEAAKELEALIFEDIIKVRKIKHAVTGHDYSYTRMLGDRALGREYELSINVISSLTESMVSPESVRMKSMTREELVILLPDDARFFKDLSLFKKTDKFVRQARTGASQDGRNRIVEEKGEQNARRRKDLTNRIYRLLGEAHLFVRGEDIETGGEDPQGRLFKAFQILVDKVYVNLPMLRGISYTEGEIAKYLQQGELLFGGEGSGLTEAEQEILNFAQGQEKLGVRVTVKALLEKFETKPYGWPNPAILCNAASLIGRGKLEARSDAAVLEGATLERGLNNSNMLGNIVLAPQVEFSASQIKRAKDFSIEFFDEPIVSGDARAVGAECGKAFDHLKTVISTLLTRKANFPFIKALEPVVDMIASVCGKPATWYISDLTKQHDAFLDAKEQTLDPIRAFMNGPQRTIYEEAREFLKLQEPNFTSVGDAEARAIRSILEDPNCYRGTSIQGVKAQHYDLKSKLEVKLIEERKALDTEIESFREKLDALPNIGKLTAAQRSNLMSPLDQEKRDVKGQLLIAVIRERANEIRSRIYPQLLAEVDRLARAAEARTPATGMSEDAAPAEALLPFAYITIREMKVPFAGAYLTAETDVNAYIEQLRTSLMGEIRQGKRIIV